jgi:hypothetical protein
MAVDVQMAMARDQSPLVLQYQPPPCRPGSVAGTWERPTGPIWRRSTPTRTDLFLGQHPSHTESQMYRQCEERAGRRGVVEMCAPRCGWPVPRAQATQHDEGPENAT